MKNIMTINSSQPNVRRERLKTGRRELLKKGASITVGGSILSLLAGCNEQACEQAPITQSEWLDYRPFEGLKERYIDVAGARLWATDTGGTGEAIILLHAHTGSALNWGYQQQFFSDLGYRVIAYSRRGYYGTELIDSDEPSSIASGSADLDAIAEAFELEQFHLLGTAAGGMVAADYAISHPEKLLSLTIACSLVGISEESYVENTKRLLPKAFHALPPEYKELSASYILANPTGVAQWKALEEQSKPNPDAFNFSRFRKSANRITAEKLRALTVPTFILTGDSDPYFPQARARSVTNMFGNAVYRLIPESGHSSYWEQYELFNALLLEFLQGKLK